MAKFRGYAAAPTLGGSAVGDVRRVDIDENSDLRQRGGDNKLFLDSQSVFNKRGTFTITAQNAASAIKPGTSGALVVVLDADSGADNTNTISNCLVSSRKLSAPYDDYSDLTISGGFVSSDGTTDPWAIT